MGEALPNTLEDLRDNKDLAFACLYSDGVDVRKQDGLFTLLSFFSSST